MVLSNRNKTFFFNLQKVSANIHANAKFSSFNQNTFKFGITSRRHDSDSLYKPNKNYINNLAFLTRIQMVPVVKALKRMIKSSKTWICLKWKSLHEILGFAHS